MYRMNWKKNAVHTAEITGYTAEGMGVARLEGRVAVVCGVDRLHAARVRAMDLRGGAALVIAGLQAHGVTTVEHLHHIRRGYSDLPGDLARLGAHIHTDITEGGASNDPTPQAQTQPPPEAAGQPCVSL